MTLKNNNGLSQQLSAGNTITRSAVNQLFQRFESADIKKHFDVWGHCCQLWINVAVGSSMELLASHALLQLNNITLVLNLTKYDLCMCGSQKKGHMTSSPVHTIKFR